MKPLHTDRDNPALGAPGLAAQIAKHTTMTPIECAVAAFEYSKIAKVYTAINVRQCNGLESTEVANAKRAKLREKAAFVTDRVTRSRKGPLVALHLEWTTDGRYGALKLWFTTDGATVFPAVNL